MLNDLLARYAAWSKQRRGEEPDYFTRLAALQAPEFFGIGCSNSRFPANVFGRLDSGEVLVHRNVANIAQGLIYGLKVGRMSDFDCSIGPGHFQTGHSRGEAAQ